MMAFPMMLIPAAEDAGMEVPDNPDSFDKETYPHFTVFCNIQLGVRMDPGDHWSNAKVIADIPKELISKIDVYGIIDRGYKYLGG